MLPSCVWKAGPTGRNHWGHLLARKKTTAWGRAALEKWVSQPSLFQGSASRSPVKFASISCEKREPSGAWTDCAVSSYLSHSCLQDLQPCLRFQFRLHQPYREDIRQALSSPCGPHLMSCYASWQVELMWTWTISKGASIMGLGISY